MRICTVGSGYVGLVAGACFAEGGNHVIGVDIDAQKIEMLNRGEIPIYEPGLCEIVQRNLKAGRIEFTTDLEDAVKRSLVIFIGVGTPPAQDGSADLSSILSVAKTIGRVMDGYRIVVMKSTVPVGTHKRVSQVIEQETEHEFDYVSNPEFLKEGAAIDDFTRPDRVVIGADNPAVIEIIKELYSPFMRRSERLLVMSPASAEMTKYAANAMLATRISFMNEIAGLCEHIGADVEEVRRGVGSDSRIGDAFLFPGVGYGGSCFPKDVSALSSMGEQVGHPMTIIDAVQEVNRRQRDVFAERILEHFKDRCSKTTLAIWGLAFKARTDDVREAPAIAVIRRLADAGIRVKAYDPEAMVTGAAALGGAAEIVADAYEVLNGADALVLFTDWPEFRTPDFDRIYEKLTTPLIFDGRNLYEPKAMARRGFTYIGIGRTSLPAQACTAGG